MSLDVAIAIGTLTIAVITATGGLLMLAAYRAASARADEVSKHLDETRGELARLERDGAAREMRCREEIGLINGRLDAVTSGWADNLGQQLGDRIVTVIRERLG